MNGLTPILCLYLAAGTVLVADSPAVPSSSLAPATPADLTAEALKILQPGYADFKSLAYQPGDKLDDLIARANGGISLVTPSSTVPVPIIPTTLPNAIIYMRLPSFTPKKGWEDVANGLRFMIDYWHAYGTIVDLRDNTSNDFAGASQAMALLPGDMGLARYFPQNSAAFVSLPFPIPDRELEGPLVVLVNDRTAGAAEVMAARLKADGALVVGRKTTGAATFFAERPLSNGQILRFAVAPLESSARPVATIPVVPDISVNVDAATEKAALAEIADNHISDVIQEAADRHRMNEAALVQGQDPEWDDYLASLEQRPGGHFLLSLPPIHDVTLIDAIDSLQAIRVSQAPVPQPPSTGADASPAASVQ